MAALRFIGTLAWLRVPGTNTDVQEATALWMTAVVKADELLALTTAPDDQVFRMGTTKMQWRGRGVSGDAVSWEAQVNDGAQVIGFVTDKSEFTEGDYYIVYMHCGPSTALLFEIRDIAGNLLGKQGGGDAQATGSTHTLHDEGTDSGTFRLVRPGSSTTNSKGATVAGFAVGPGTRAAGDRHVEPASVNCFALFRFDSPGSGSDPVTAVVGSDGDIRNNTNSPGSATSGQFEWLPSEGPWNGEGGEPPESAIAAISSGYHIRGMR